MARIFRQRYTATDPTGRKSTRQSRKWYIEYRNSLGIRRRVPGYTDKMATQQLAGELERRAVREQSGLVDRYAEHRKRPLSEHVAGWRQSLLDNGATQSYADLSANRVTATLVGTEAIFWHELDADRVSGYLADRRRAGLSIETSNHYVRRAKQFARWMVKSKRAPDDPLGCLTLLNSRVDRRHDRRALAEDELRTLLTSTRTGPTRFGLTGSDRARLYQLAVETGLRASELRSLTWASFDLVADPPTVTVKAAYSKHRRDDTLPLKASTAQFLARWRDESGRVDAGHGLFATMRPTDKMAKMLRADLAEAGILYRDDAGRVADFHSLRHTFITNLARGGVYPKVAQQLARHSTITLTMDRYSHTVIGDLSDGVQALPDLNPVQPAQERQRATGTCDIAENVLPLSLPKNLPRPAASQEPPVASDCTKATNEGGVSQQEKAVEQGVSCTSVHRTAPACTEDESLRVLGLEPRTYGLKGRCPESVSDGPTTTYDAADSVLTDLLTALEPKSPDLAAVVRAWPELPEPVRAGIVAMVGATHGPGD